jgi:heat shock protein HtpX
MNGLKTALLLGALSGMLLLMGEYFGGRQGLVIGLGMAVAMNFISYFFSDKIALKMYRAQPVTETENREIYRRVAPMVNNLTQRMSIPMPKLWVIPDESPNAFATGRNPNHSSVAFTAGLVRLMDERELEGVVAHELAHIRNRDILISSLAATIAAAIMMAARFAMFFGGSRDDSRGGVNPIAALAMLILAPLAAMMIQMAISRTREFSADATAAKHIGSPFGLASALQKLESYSKRIPMDASPATAHMFIVKPLGGGGFSKLFSTHPPTQERVERLMSLR